MATAGQIPALSSIAEIEAPIENLPATQVDELAGWLETLRVRRATLHRSKAGWSARGAAAPGVTTAKVMALTRGEE